MVTAIEKKNTRFILIREIPVEIKNRFKGFCSERGLTMQDTIVALMEMVSDGEINETVLERWIEKS